jgi:PhzF family phenazine biosynthesis protein
MQAVAAEVGYSETAFAAPAAGEWRVRYFAPEVEVDFCGHATIALGAALASAHGNGVFPLRLNHARITVEGCWTEGVLSAAFQSPPTRSSAAREELVAEALALFELPAEGLDPRIPPAIVNGGADTLFSPSAIVPCWRRCVTILRLDGLWPCARPSARSA